MDGNRAHETCKLIGHVECWRQPLLNRPVKHDEADHPDSEPDHTQYFVPSPHQQIRNTKDKEAEESKADTKEGKHLLCGISPEAIKENQE